MSWRHLRVRIPIVLKDKYKINFVGLYKDTKQKLHDLAKPTYSWIERIDIVKTFITPKFLFLFRMLSLNIPEVDLKTWQHLLNDFIWANKQHQILFWVLYQATRGGGLGIPDLKSYEAANLTTITRMTEQPHIIDWMKIKIDFCDDTPEYDLQW